MYTPSGRSIWPLWVVCLMVLGIFGLALTEIHSFDIFWQLQSGRYLLETGTFVRRDLFTLAADVPRFEHCWLHDLFFYLAWKVGGYASLSWVKALLLSATAACLVITAKIRGGSWLSVLCLLPLYLMTSAGWLARPQLWTFLGFSLTLLILECYCQGKKRALFWIVPLGYLWINLHAGSILLLALFLAYLVGEAGALVRWGSQLTRVRYGYLWAALVVVVFTVILTPYAGEWFETLAISPRLGVQKDSTGQVSGSMLALFNMDWRPTSFREDAWFYYAMGLSSIMLLLSLRRLNLRDVCLLAGLSLMGLKLSRHTSFLFMGMLAILPIYLDSAIQPIIIRLSEKLRSVAMLIVSGAAIGVFVFAAQPLYEKSGWFSPGLRGWHYPVEAADFIEQQQLSGNLYNTYDWGGFLAWRLFPDYRVFWDGRQNSPQMFRLGWNVMAGKSDWSSILQEFGINTIVTRCLTLDTGERYPLLDRLQKDVAWSLVFASDASLVFVRNASMGDEWLAEHALPKARINQTIRSEAGLSLDVNRWRYKAWWELARLDLQERRYAEAFVNLGNYLSRSPRPDPLAENYYRMLYPIYNNREQVDGK